MSPQSRRSSTHHSITSAKLYRKRNKVHVELTATIPIQGSESEILEKLFASDFLALLGTNQREIVVLLPSGLPPIQNC